MFGDKVRLLPLLLLLLQPPFLEAGVPPAPRKKTPRSGSPSARGACQEEPQPSRVGLRRSRGEDRTNTSIPPHGTLSNLERTPGYLQLYAPWDFAVTEKDIKKLQIVGALHPLTATGQRRA